MIEAVWLDPSTEHRNFYKGLIQAAAALHHVQNHNGKGALQVYRSAVRYLKPYQCAVNPPSFMADAQYCANRAVPFERAPDRRLTKRYREPRKIKLTRYQSQAFGINVKKLICDLETFFEVMGKTGGDVPSSISEFKFPVIQTK
ncbi:MAG: hypothetical protein A3A73_02520 [Omnitrophica bacterium RIFCSPLOWO2_01_FULL_50_24]|nr:MAG: hypothetical protein A3A73_02520 [Omnitrophica bacterium RIFCSPLOWO2_01_FULL_50_24]